MADGTLVGIRRKPSTDASDQYIMSVTQDAAGGGTTNMIMELVQMKGIEGATVTHAQPTVNTGSLPALAVNLKRVVAFFYNAGTEIVYLNGGGTAGTTDMPLEPGMSFTDQWTTVPWNVISGSASGNDLRVTEVTLP